MVNTTLRCRFNRAPHTYFFAETFQRKNRRVCRHTNGQNNAGNACQRKAELPQQRKHCQNAQIHNREHQHGSCGNNAQALVEEKQVNNNQQQTNQRNNNTRHQSILTKRWSYYLALRVREAYRQRAAFQNGLQRFCIVKRIVAGDRNFTTRDFRLHRRRALYHAVKQNNNLAFIGNQIFRGLGKSGGAFGIKR